MADHTLSVCLIFTKKLGLALLVDVMLIKKKVVTLTYLYLPFLILCYFLHSGDAVILCNCTVSYKIYHFYSVLFICYEVVFARFVNVTAS